MRFGFAMAVVVLLLASPTRADYDAAVQARARGDNATALNEARKGAQAGDPRAQRLYGQMLLKDSGPRADPREGITWLKAAADQGDGLARRELGNAYLAGTGVPRNPKEAVVWLRKASESGDTISQSSLAFLLADGKDVPKDLDESARWMRAAADQGDSQAQLALAQYYVAGTGVTKDLLQAYVWVSLAVRARDPKASDLRRELAQQITADQRREGDQLVRAWGTSRVEAKATAARMTGTGTGFIVTADGYVLTNDHVIRSCKEIRIRRFDESIGAAKLVAQSSEEDLALLKADLRADAVAPFRAVGDSRQGDAVIAFGYPLTGTLATSGNAMAGKITAVAGLGNDTRFLQTSTAPEPGNTGGPVLDLNGRVVGVTAASIGTQAAGQTTSGTAQNLNFAIKGDVAAAFLKKHGVSAVVTGGTPRAMSSPEVADRAKRFTVRVECLT